MYFDKYLFMAIHFYSKSAMRVNIPSHREKSKVKYLFLQIRQPFFSQKLRQVNVIVLKGTRTVQCEFN